MNKISVGISAFLILVGISLHSQDTNWSHFRGSNLDGICRTANIPVKWNDTTNILWKVPINGKGWSSPVVWGNQVWITSATTDGKQMFGVCLNKKTGKEIFNLKLFESATTYSKHDFNTYATPTPCIEDGFVYIHFGTSGTACVKTNDGSIVWKRTDLNCEHVQGPASSPIIYKNMLILHIEGTDFQYIVALDKATGKTIWKTDRPKELYDKLKPIGKKAYITPIVINIKGRDILISNGSAVCIAYDILTGKEIWRFIQGEDSTISMPVTENGIVYFYTGFVTPSEGEQYSELVAIDPGGTGDITSTPFVKWRFKEPVLQLLTPVIKDGLIYTINTKNQFNCIDAATGIPLYTRRMTAKYNSSPFYAGGNIYFTSVGGETTLIKEGRKLDIVSRNKINGEIYATPAISGNQLFIRTATDLYCISRN
ncbi:MAG TPA: PQQ-binding-like beta-propeller repeat protein [Bacteroidales bacterium]|nr:PQQ-binding-like beta-propeller repeat protein [Bacteroidales bacterium]